MQKIIDNAITRNARVKVADIVIGTRQRDIDMHHVKKLKESFNLIGTGKLLEPILVSEENMLLLDGAHRLTAAKEAGWEEIDVILWRGLTQEEALVIESATNAVRLELSPLQAEQAWRYIYGPLQEKRRKEQKEAAIAQARSYLSDAENTVATKSVATEKLEGRDFAKEMTGMSLERIQQVQKIREISEDKSKPEAVRKAAEQAMVKLANPRASVSGLFKKVADAEAGASKTRQDAERRRTQEMMENYFRQTVRMTQILDKTDVLKSVLGWCGKEDLSRDTVIAFRNSLSDALGVIAGIEARVTGLSVKTVCMESAERVWGKAGAVRNRVGDVDD